jgi:hypothetical protein
VLVVVCDDLRAQFCKRFVISGCWGSAAACVLIGAHCVCGVELGATGAVVCDDLRAVVGFCDFRLLGFTAAAACVLIGARGIAVLGDCHWALARGV